MASKAGGKMHFVDFSSVRHHVESEVESAAPDVFHFGVAELGIDINHAAAKDFRTLANGVFGFGEEGGAATEEHAIVGRQPVVIEEVFRVVDHAVAGAEFSGEIGRQAFRGDDVGADGDDFFSQGGSGVRGVSAGGENHFAGGNSAFGSFDQEVQTRTAATPEPMGDFLDARVIVEASAGALSGVGQACNVARRVQARAGFVNHAAEINVGADFGAKLTFWDDALMVLEFALDAGGGFGVSVEMGLLAGNLEVAAAGEVAVDVFIAHDLFDQIDGLGRRFVHIAHGEAAVAFDESGNRQFHAGEDHAAVAATGAPAEGFGFEDGDTDVAFGESESRRESAKAAADDGDVDVFGQIAVRLHRWYGYGFEPIVFFVNRHERFGAKGF